MMISRKFLEQGIRNLSNPRLKRCRERLPFEARLFATA
jgi:hypothetical protein